MTEEKTSEDEEIRGWYTKLLDRLVKEMISLKAISGAAVQANPMWMSPKDMLIAKVWGVGYEQDFVWAIAVDPLIADYVAGSIARTPRDAARHFSLKWQMDAERLTSFEENEAKADVDKARLQDYGGNLSKAPNCWPSW